MLEKLKMLYEKLLVSTVIKQTYTLYKIHCLCKNKEHNFTLVCEKYSMWNKDELLDYELLYHNKTVVKGVPICNIEKFEVEILDIMDCYIQEDDFRTRSVFKSKEDIIKQNNKMKRKIELYKKYKIEIENDSEM